MRRSSWKVEEHQARASCQGYRITVKVTAMPPWEDWPAVSSGDPQLLREIRQLKDEPVYSVRVVPIKGKRGPNPQRASLDPQKASNMMIPAKYVRSWYEAKLHEPCPGEDQVSTLTSSKTPEQVMDLWRQNERHHQELQTAAPAEIHRLTG